MAASSSTELGDLVREFQIGSNVAAEELFNRCRKPLLVAIRRVLSRPLRKVFDAEDFLLDTFMEILHRKFPDNVLRSPLALWAYLRKIAVNKVRDAKRKFLETKRHGILSEVSLEDLHPDNEPSTRKARQPEVAEWGPAAIAQLMERLPLIDRHIVRLMFQGHRTKVVANMLALKPKEIYRALDRIRDLARVDGWMDGWMDGWKFGISVRKTYDMSSDSPGYTLSDSSSASNSNGPTYYWLWVMCLLGLDYFSTLAYQPSITFHETKRLGPLATAAVVLLTLFGALPIYCYLAGRSPGGQGSLGIINRLIHGWHGKTLVLVLLGFAATDFVMLKTLSLADAAVHVLNQHDGSRQEIAKSVADWMHEYAMRYGGPYAASFVNNQLVATIALSIITFIFWFVLRKGFNRNVLILAVPLVGLFLVMTGILIAGGIWHFCERPQILDGWLEHVQFGNHEISVQANSFEGWGTVVLLSLLVLPNLALGLSGFELSMILMPQVRGVPGEQPPKTRIRNTRKVFIMAALIMSVFLLGSVLVTTLLIPAREFGPRGLANSRALAYLAHGGSIGHINVEGKEVLDNAPLLPICGIAFGTAYDVVTVLILCLAGTSVMTALAVLLPKFLLRFGMELHWAQRWGVLLMLFAVINMVVTLYFKAEVEEQRNAYATGVLVLIASSAVATVVDKRRVYQKAQDKGWAIVHYANIGYYVVIAMIFVTTMLVVLMRSGGGLTIATYFIMAILTMSILSRAWRADELRTVGFRFNKETNAEFLWNSLRNAEFDILVPLHPGQDYDQKEKEIRERHHLSEDADLVFLEVCIEDPSDFFQKVVIDIVHHKNRYIIKVTNCVSVAHAIAAIALEMSKNTKPPALHFGWPENGSLAASWSYLAFGEGNIPWKVHELIRRAEPDPVKRPRVVVG